MAKIKTQLTAIDDKDAEHRNSSLLMVMKTATLEVAAFGNFLQTKHSLSIQSSNPHAQKFTPLI